MMISGKFFPAVRPEDSAIDAAEAALFGTDPDRRAKGDL
jgi:hypothetical protein